jgi:4-amino-4-deoxy-L-arabinose transferase-like glycosyltransferase
LNIPRLFNSLFSVLLAGMLFSSLRMYGKKTAFVLTCAVVLSPVFLILGRSFYAENTVVLFLAAGCLSLYRFRKKAVRSPPQCRESLRLQGHFSFPFSRSIINK